MGAGKLRDGKLREIKGKLRDGKLRDGKLREIKGQTTIYISSIA
jgi:hypothetical protein